MCKVVTQVQITNSVHTFAIKISSVLTFCDASKKIHVNFSKIINCTCPIGLCNFVVFEYSFVLINNKLHLKSSYYLYLKFFLKYDNILISNKGC